MAKIFNMVTFRVLDRFKEVSNDSAFIKDFRNYITGDFFIKIVSLISIAVFTRILTVEDYGIFGVFNASIGLLMTILTLGFHTAVSRYFFEHQADFSSFLFISMVGSIFIATLLLFLIWQYKDISAQILNIPSQLITLFLPAIIIGIISSIFSQYYSSIRQSGFLIRVEVVKAYVSFLASLTIVLMIEKSYRGLIVGGLIVGGILSIYMLSKLWKLMLPSFNRKHLIYIASFSVPLIPYHASSLILQQFDRIMINTQLGNYESGLFNFAANVALLYLLFTAVVMRAFYSDYFNLMNEKNYKDLDNKVLKIFYIYIIVATFLIFFGNEIVLVLADKKFIKAISIIPILVSGYVFFSIFDIYGRNAIYAYRTVYASINILIPGVLNIILNNLLIQKFGYMGAAYATLISYMLMAMIAYFISVYIIKIHSFSLQRLIVPMCIFTFSVGMYYSLSALDISSSMFFIAKFFIFCLIVFLLIRSVIKVGHDVQ